MTFSVEVENPSQATKSEHTVHIFVDFGEIDQIFADLKRLRKREPENSVSYFTKGWGGGALSETRYREDSAITNHLRIWLIEDGNAKIVSGD